MTKFDVYQVSCVSDRLYRHWPTNAISPLAEKWRHSEIKRTHSYIQDCAGNIATQITQRNVYQHTNYTYKLWTH